MRPRLFIVLPLLLPGVVPSAPTSASAPGSGPKALAGRVQDRNQEAEGPGSTGFGRADRFFSICDYDASGWISFSEAEASLGIDRAGFRAYDNDRDGMIIAGEFRRRYEEITATGGVFLPPRPKSVAREPVPEGAEEVLEAYDKDGDGALDPAELEVVLVKIGDVKLEPETILEQLDRDLTRKLEIPEIEDLLSILKPSAGGIQGSKPRTIDELFGKLLPRALQQGSTPQPVRISSPVRSFRRLDIDRDGAITREDLAELQRPLVLPVRTPAVLAALDTDRDGAISEAEFLASMRTGR